MELRQLRYFVALAEELNFTRAAERLHMTQPPLSQQIKLLEEELGVLLFSRGPRGVQLTGAGRTFLVHARALIGGAAAAVQETAAAAAGSIGTVRIGTINSAMFNALPKILRHLRRKFPSLDVSVVELGSQPQLRALLLDELDLGIMHQPHPTPGLVVERLLREPVCVALPSTHPLAARASIGLSSFSQSDFVFTSREVTPVSFDNFVALCVAAGFSPRIRHTAAHPASIVEMVKLGLGVALLPQSLRDSRASGVRFVRLKDKAAVVDMFLVSKEAEMSQLVGNVKDSIVGMSF